MKLFKIALIMALLLALAAESAPPSPEAVAKMKQDGTWEQFLMKEAQFSAEACDPACWQTLDRMRQQRRDQADQIEIPLPIILVDFPDRAADRQTHTIQYFQDLLFGNDPYCFRNFYLTNSYNEVNMSGEIMGWVQMQSEYEPYCSDALNLAADAVRAVDNQFDFSQLDLDDDGSIPAVMIIFAGPGHEVTGNPDDIHSHAGGLGIRVDGVTISRYSVSPELAPREVAIHEVGHSVFGLPDLYDYDNSSYGLGDWSMMSGANNCFDCWCKIQLGWIRPTIVRRNMNRVVIPPVETQPLAYKIPLNGDNEYFLIENRQRLGYDQTLPGTGLLIYHVDENQFNNNNENHYKVAIEQADGERDLENKNNYGDDSDPFPGSSGNTTFDANSNPNSRDYNGQDRSIAVRNIRLNGSDVSCDLMNGLEGQNFLFDLVSVSPENTVAGRDVTVSYTLHNDGNTRSSATTVRLSLSRDTRRSDDDITLGMDQGELELAPEGTSEQVLQRTIPADIESGAWHVLATADPAGRVNELDESDNVGSARILIGGQPNIDLQRFSLSPRNVLPGREFSMNYALENNGGEPTGAFTVEFYLSTDTLRNQEDFSLGEAENEANLPAGRQIERTINRRIPELVTPGEYYVLIFVDRLNHVRELDEDDNAAAARLTVPGPNLRALYLTVSPTELRPDDEFDIEAWVVNTGLLNSPPSGLGIALSPDRNLSFGDCILGAPYNVDSLAIGDTAYVSIRRTIPSDAWTRDWYILIKCDCFGRIDEINENDNVTGVPVHITSEGVEDDREVVPECTRLLQPYPNPANAEIHFTFEMKNAGIARLVIYDVNGSLIKQLTAGEYPIGRHTLIWQAEGVPDGLYLAQLRTADVRESVKFLMLK